MPNQIVITGGLGRDAELKFTQSGIAVLNGSVADTPRRLNKDTNQWEDAGDTLWLTFSIFGDDAENLAEHLTKGTKVTVVGKLKARSFTTRDGDERTVTEIAADSIAIHARRERQQQGAGWSRDAKTEDPWAGQTDPWGAK